MLTTSLIIGITISIVINVFLYKALTAQIKKVNLYEMWIIEYERWVDDARNVVKDTYLKMKSVDDKGLFFKDDDVGFIFSELLTLLKTLNDKLQK